MLALLAPASERGSLGRLDHYEMLEVVGSGGMGVVFKARDSKLQRVVAVKVLAPQLAASTTARRRFVREAQAGAAVRDDHVVGIYAVNDEGTVPYLVMEFIAGINLAQRVKQGGPLEVKEVLRIGLQAARGLAAAHAQGLIHRDVKPGNILLENGVQRVKITDFGLARAADDASLTQSGVIAGTPLFMSPEQARGEALDPRSDLFSLGSVLYALCTGQQAFQAGNTLAVLKRVCEDTPRPIREVNPDVPDWLAAVVDRLLAKEAGARFRSAAELAELLGQYLAHLQQSRRTPGPPEWQEGPRRAPAQAGPGSRVARKRQRWAVAAVLLVGVVASLVTVTVLSRRGSSPAPGKSPVPPDPRVLTVSQKPEDGGRFRTIQEALDEVEPGMTIRVLGGGRYREFLLIDQPDRYRNVTLEATTGAVLEAGLPASKNREAVAIVNVPGFTLRGFRIESLPGHRESQVFVTGSCPGALLDRLDLRGHADCIGVGLARLAHSGRDRPVVVQNCTMRNFSIVVGLFGCAWNDHARAVPCGHVVVRQNTMRTCNECVALHGAVHRALVVGNRLMNARMSALDLRDLLPGTKDVLMANNTVFRSGIALRIWDDHRQGKAFLKCKGVRVLNNLSLASAGPDMWLLEHARGVYPLNARGPGDVEALRATPGWQFGHNWREGVRPTPGSQLARFWIPPSASDRLVERVELLSRKPADPDFLRPAKDSPLARGGAGVSDASLPAYVGAVPPQGVEPWDWDRTWKMLARKEAARRSLDDIPPAR
jgi:tRNA A-37 threonylcarbamoyl transferase component Bud32